MLAPHLPLLMLRSYPVIIRKALAGISTERERKSLEVLNTYVIGVYEEMGMMGQAQAYYKQCSKLGTARGHGMIEEEKRRKKAALNRDKGQEEGDYGAACASRSRALARKLAAWREAEGQK